MGKIPLILRTCQRIWDTSLVWRMVSSMCTMMLQLQTNISPRTCPALITTPSLMTWTSSLLSSHRAQRMSFQSVTQAWLQWFLFIQVMSGICCLTVMYFEFWVCGTEHQHTSLKHQLTGTIWQLHVCISSVYCSLISMLTYFSCFAVRLTLTVAWSSSCPSLMCTRCWMRWRRWRSWR